MPRRQGRPAVGWPHHFRPGFWIIWKSGRRCIARRSGSYRLPGEASAEQAGAAALTASSQLEKVLAFLDQNEEITPTSTDYRSAASIKAAARKQGPVVELPDCLIAAIAVRMVWPLATGNTADFRVIQSLRLLTAIYTADRPRQCSASSARASPDNNSPPDCGRGNTPEKADRGGD